jgi:hypothetical protein
MPRRETALDELARIEQAHRDAVAFSEQTLAEQRAAQRRLEAVQSPLLQYHEDVGAGRREPDEAAVRELVEQCERDEIAARREVNALMAKHTGTLHAVEARHGDIARYISQHREQLTDVLIPQSIAAGEGLLAARDAFYEAIGEWARAANLWRRFLEQWHESPTIVPPHPLAGATGDIDAAFAPMYSGEPRDPRRLWPMPPEHAPVTATGERT